MTQSLLSERAVRPWFSASHPSPAGQREQVLALKLGPTVAAPDRVELEDICGGHILEEQRRVLLLVGTLLEQHGQRQQIYQAVEDGPYSEGDETRFLEQMTNAARASQI
jgi:hypothetical protein